MDESNLTFWPYTLAGFGMAMPSTAMMFHNYNILGQSGIGHAASTAASGTLGIIAAVSNLVAGRFSIRSLTVYRSASILIGGSTTGIGGAILHGISLWCDVRILDANLSELRRQTLRPPAPGTWPPRPA